MSVLFLFIDGLGLGQRESLNPLASLSLPAFERLAGGQKWTAQTPTVVESARVFRGIDANLGIDGFPQSGTGQATLFTGVNCAKLAGRHYGPYPHSKTRPVLAEKNIFRQIQDLSLPFSIPASFANAYPDRFFRYVEKRDRWTVTTRCCLDAGVRIRTHEDLVKGNALPADLTAQGWPQKDPLLLPITENEAARRFRDLAQAHGLLLLEYFHSDKVGHSQSSEHAALVLKSLDRFLFGLLEVMSPEGDLLLITSDHGNLEDLSTKSHTRNPVPLAAYGRGANHFRDVYDLTGVLPAILRALAEAY